MLAEGLIAVALILVSGALAMSELAIVDHPSVAHLRRAGAEADRASCDGGPAARIVALLNLISIVAAPVVWLLDKSGKRGARRLEVPE